MQFHQMVDACLFAIAFWLAYEIRATELPSCVVRLIDALYQGYCCDWCSVKAGSAIMPAIAENSSQLVQIRPKP